MDQVKRKLEVLKLNNQELIKKTQDSEVEVENFRKIVAQLTSEVEALSEKCSEKDRNIDDLEAQYSEVLEKCYTHEQAAEEQFRASVISKHGTHGKRANELISSLNGLKKKIDEAEAKREKYSSQIAGLESDLAEMEFRTEESERESRELNDKHIQLTNEFKSQTTTKGKSEEKTQKIARNIEACKLKRDQEQKAVKELEEEEARLKEELEQLEEKLVDAQEAHTQTKLEWENTLQELNSIA